MCYFVSPAFLSISAAILNILSKNSAPSRSFNCTPAVLPISTQSFIKPDASVLCTSLPLKNNLTKRSNERIDAMPGSVSKSSKKKRRPHFSANLLRHGNLSHEKDLSFHDLRLPRNRCPAVPVQRFQERPLAVHARLGVRVVDV